MNDWKDERKGKHPVRRVSKAGLFLFILLFAQDMAWAQLNGNCTVSVLNRTAEAQSDGNWSIPNVPSGFGAVRARATCVENGQTASGSSGYFTVPANGTVSVEQIILGQAAPVPSSLIITAPGGAPTGVGATAQLTVTALYPNNLSKDVTSQASGTTYIVSTPSAALVSPDGLLTALSGGRAVVTATNDGATGFIRSSSVSPETAIRTASRTISRRPTTLIPTIPSTPWKTRTGTA